MAVQIDQALAGEEAQPEVKRHAGISGVLRQSACEVDVRLLEHVGRIEPTLQPAIQPQTYHLPQAIAVQGEHLGQRILVAGRGTANQFFRVGGGIGHNSSLPEYPYAVAKYQQDFSMFRTRSMPYRQACVLVK